MQHLLRVTGVNQWLPAILLFLAAFTAQAQCPIANTCSPGPGSPPSGNLVFGMGIFNVNVNNGAINNTTLGASQGYQDYSCTIGASIPAAVAIPISIQTNPNANENVKVWIDYNNDGAFNATTELAFSSLNNKLHVGNITIPATATLNTALRMRVSADNFSSPLPTPCSTPQYSQVEDYRITVTANTNAPAPEFSASSTTTCSPVVNFTDLSQNGPTSWSWNFGDNSSSSNTSTLQNPSHTYSGPGIYTVTLTACNAAGCQTITKTNYITYHTNIPAAATCTPGTANYCCGYGITNVNFGSGLMTNTSANGAAGYQDFTCSKSVTVIAGNSYPISLTSGSNPQDTRIYIDLNNDGNFTGPNEMVVAILNQVNPSGTITIPGTTLMNTPLRMRIISDEIGSSFNSCGGIQSGQAEDYTIKITPNPNPPVANFTSTYATACDTTVQFTSTSTNAPTSWLWNFGDPASASLNTSTLPNPIHVYHTAGTYTVTLTATNANGSNTIIKTDFITVVKPCLNYCSSTGHTNTNLYISNVSLSTLNNSTTQAVSGYANYTAMSATLIQGSSATLSVTRGGLVANSGVSAWIDYNRNGIFETSERVMAVNATNTVATAPILVPATALLGSTRMRVMAYGGSTIAPTNPCVMNQFNMEVEDYTINIQTNLQPPVVNFTVPSQTICTGTAQFSDNSINVPTSWSWDFGDPTSSSNTSTLQNPTHTYATTGQYTVKLTACNSFGCQTVTKTNFINYDPNAAYCTNVIMPATGTGPTATSCNASIFDPGGPTGQYPNSANSIVTIAPGSNSTVTLTFSAFDLEANWDFLKIYDGPSTSSPLLFTLTGTTIPAPITSTGSALTLQFTSDNVATRDGFAATWTCTPITTPPVANFKADLTNICTGAVQFNDLSTNGATSWSWDFGNGNTSTLQNPIANYSTSAPGVYNVTLTSCNSFGCNTVTKSNLINITIPCLTYCPSNGHNNTQQWISNVTAGGTGGINNNSGADANGYGNYTYLSANMMLGTSTNPYSVSLGSNLGGFGYVAIWIDLNKDGIFQTTERVINQQATAAGPGGTLIASGNIAIPASASTGLTRMRVLVSQINNQTNPCILNQLRAEAEDYTINIQPNNLPTVADFTANLNTVCTGIVQFTDASLNGATSWSWDFGNGNTSTLQNPTAIYSTTTPGSYNVTLTACKNGVCSTVTKAGFVNITVPCLTYCISSGHTTPNQYLSKVTMGTINNTTAADPSGYGNYVYLTNNVMIGSTNNTFSAELGNSSGPFAYIAVWIDLNKDGIFQTTERVFNQQAINISFGSPLTAAGTISIPNTAATGLARMRVVMSQNFNLTSPCLMNQFNMEVEDYTVNIQPNTLPTVADFTADLNTVCSGSVPFFDASSNGATSWSWDFGNGNTSTLQNPIANYSTSTPGNYTVTLTACKNGICNTVTKTNFVTITVPCLTYCATSGHNNGNQWIGNVTIGTINNTTSAEPNGYGNYTYQNTTAIKGTTSNTFSVTLGNNSGPFTYVAGFIDLNRDGVFQATERVFNQQATNSSFGSPIVAAGTFIIPATATTGITRMRIFMSQNFNLTSPCLSSQFNAEVEDYNINIQPNTIPPIVNFSGTPTVNCNGLATFTDLSTNGATSWLWDFGDGITSSLQNPTHTYTTAGLYTVTLTACNSFGCQTVTKTGYINFDPNNVACRTVLMPINASVFTATTCSGTLYDDGGVTGNYSNNADGTVTISPVGASHVTLTFTSFSTEAGFDFVTIYDGPSTSSPVLGGPYSGSFLPNSGSPLTSTGGSITVRYTTDNSAVGPGFEAVWNCTQLGLPAEVNNSGFEIYPNPTKGLVNLKLKTAAPEDYTVEVTNTLSQVLKVKKVTFADNQEQQIDLSQQAKGIYFIKIRNSKTTTIKKVVLD